MRCLCWFRKDLHWHTDCEGFDLQCQGIKGRRRWGMEKTHIMCLLDEPCPWSVPFWLERQWCHKHCAPRRPRPPRGDGWVGCKVQMPWTFYERTEASEIRVLRENQGSVTSIRVEGWRNRTHSKVRIDRQNASARNFWWNTDEPQLAKSREPNHYAWSGYAWRRFGNEHTILRKSKLLSQSYVPSAPVFNACLGYRSQFHMMDSTLRQILHVIDYMVIENLGKTASRTNFFIPSALFLRSDARSNTARFAHDFKGRNALDHQVEVSQILGHWVYSSNRSPNFPFGPLGRRRRWKWLLVELRACRRWLRAMGLLVQWSSRIGGPERR